MKYMGSKTRIAKYILPIILRNIENNEYFYDICCGGANLIDKVPNTIKRMGVDSNKYLIKALELIRDNPELLPKDKTETNELIYKEMKKSDDIGLKGYYGFALSYGGKWFGGWRRDKLNKRDYVAEAYRNARKQSNKLWGCKFICSDYKNITFPDAQCIVYIDPPYANTTGYKNNIDYDYFWSWVRELSYFYEVYVSEYNAPDDFECLYSKEIVSSLTKNTGDKVGIEKLFKIKGEINNG